MSGTFHKAEDDTEREHLLARVFEKTPADEIPGLQGQFETAVLSRIIVGLIFSQRPIGAATQEMTERHDLGPRGAFMLSLIKRGVAFPKDLATILRIGRSLVTAELARLTEAGLVVTIAHEDRRRSQLQLTALGEEANTQVRGRLLATLEHRLAGYSPQQVALLADMLETLQEGGTQLAKVGK